MEGYYESARADARVESPVPPHAYHGGEGRGRRDRYDARLDEATWA